MQKKRKGLESELAVENEDLWEQFILCAANFPEAQKDDAFLVLLNRWHAEGFDIPAIRNGRTEQTLMHVAVMSKCIKTVHFVSMCD